MDMVKLVRPMPLPEFVDRARSGETFVVRGNPDKFSHLITLEEIEMRLNDGCNFAKPVQIIKDGKKHQVLEHQVAWSPHAVKKKEVLELLQQRHSFMMVNMSQINRKVANLIDSIEDLFPNARADLHIYVSTKADASGYHAHRDRPQHKLYLQVIGSTQWKVFKYRQGLEESVVSIGEHQEHEFLDLEMQFDLEPGDLMYMPPDVFHKVRNCDGPRVSLSIPFSILVNGADLHRMDRTYIPFKEMFVANH